MLILVKCNQGKSHKIFGIFNDMQGVGYSYEVSNQFSVSFTTVALVACKRLSLNPLNQSFHSHFHNQLLTSKCNTPNIFNAFLTDLCCNDWIGCKGKTSRQNLQPMENLSFSHWSDKERHLKKLNRAFFFPDKNDVNDILLYSHCTFYEIVTKY